MKTVTCIFAVLCAAFVCFCNADETVKAERVIKLGDGCLKQKNYDGAAEKYWQAAKQGNKEAIQHLSDLYNMWNTVNAYDWEIVRKNIQEAADARYKNETTYAYKGRFIIVAPENIIIAKLGIEKIQRKYGWGGNYRCQNAIEALARRLKLTGKNGEFLTRQYDCGKSLGWVALLSREEALKNFKFPENVSDIGCFSVFVISPDDPNMLIPFEDFHTYSYHRKMMALFDICQKLGAKRITLNNIIVDKQNVNARIDVKGITNLGQVESSTDVKVQSTAVATSQVVVDFGKTPIAVLPHVRPNTPWLESEPTWRGMIEGRYNKTNPLKEFDVVFRYEKDFGVNVDSRNAFITAGVNGNFNAKAEYKNVSSIEISLHVEFKYPMRQLF